MENKTRTALLPAEDPLIQVSTDMDHNGAYGRVWLVATADRVLVIPEGADPTAPWKSPSRISWESAARFWWAGIVSNLNAMWNPQFASSTPGPWARNSPRSPVGSNSCERAGACGSTPSRTASVVKNASGCCPYGEASARHAPRARQPCAA